MRGVGGGIGRGGWLYERDDDFAAVEFQWDKFLGVMVGGAVRAVPWKSLRWKHCARWRC